jgi:PAS domain-containing protein
MSKVPAAGQIDLRIAEFPKLADDHYRDVLDALPCAIYTTDSAGRITSFNRAALLARRSPAAA